MELNQSLKNAHFIQCQEVGSDESVCGWHTHNCILMTPSGWICWAELCMHAQLLICVWLSVAPWTVGRQSSLSIEFPRQEYWRGTQSLLQGIFLTQQTHISCIAGRLFTTDPLGKPWIKYEKKETFSEFSSFTTSIQSDSFFVPGEMWGLASG